MEKWVNSPGVTAVSIDLKWSLWSADEAVWEEYAPDTLSHLRSYLEGEDSDSGDIFCIHTAPRKEIRFGHVTLDHETSLVVVTFLQEWDDGTVEPFEDSFPLPSTLAEFLSRVDGVEERMLTGKTS